MGIKAEEPLKTEKRSELGKALAKTAVTFELAKKEENFIYTFTCDSQKIRDEWLAKYNQLKVIARAPEK